MLIKKFEAPTMNEALKGIKEEFGPEAVILSTKNLKRMLGLSSKQYVEVTAGISERSLSKKKVTEAKLPKDMVNQVKQMKATHQADTYDNYINKIINEKNGKDAYKPASASNDRIFQGAKPSSKAIDKVNNKFGKNIPDLSKLPISNNLAKGLLQTLEKKLGNEKTPLPASEIKSKITARRYADIGDDFQNVEKIEFNKINEGNQESQMAKKNIHSQKEAVEDVESLKSELHNLKKLVTEIQFDKSKTSHLSSSSSIDNNKDNEILLKYYEQLLLSGVEKKFVNGIFHEVKAKLSAKDLLNEDKVLEAVALEVMSEIKSIDALEIAKASSVPTIISIVGPTGVGKTTTIAKIASIAMLKNNLRVGLINLDNYKVGASDHLLTYAKILNAQCENASNTFELQKAIKSMNNLDLILIDTTGRSQKDGESLSLMKDTLGNNAQISNYLILSASTRDMDNFEAFMKFSQLNLTGLIVSKLDETSSFGAIYNLAKRTQLKFSYFTTGQRVPEDIENASPERVVDLIFDL